MGLSEVMTWRFRNRAVATMKRSAGSRWNSPGSRRDSIAISASMPITTSRILSTANRKNEAPSPPITGPVRRRRSSIHNSHAEIADTKIGSLARSAEAIASVAETRRRLPSPTAMTAAVSSRINGCFQVAWPWRCPSIPDRAKDREDWPVPLRFAPILHRSAVAFYLPCNR